MKTRRVNPGKWGETFKKILDASGDWPKGIQLKGDRMYKDGQLCIPTTLQDPWIRGHHEFLGHVGPERLWKDIEGKYQFADKERTKKLFLKS